MANVAEFNIDFTDLKVLNETLNKTTDKVELMASSAKKDFNRLKMAIDPVARAQKMFKDQVLVAQKAVATNSISNKQYAETFKMIQANAAKAGVQLNQFGQVASVNTRSMKKFGAVGMQQVGYQVQDFAVQVQGGTSAMVALGQQGSQLLGIFGPAGAIAGMILAIGTGLAGAFMAARSSSASALSKFESFTAAMKAMKEEIEDLTLKNYMFTNGIENTSLALKKLALDAIEANIAAYEAMTTFEKMVSNLKNRIKYALSGELEDQADTLRKEAEALKKLLEEFRENEGSTEESKDEEKRLKDKDALIKKYAEEHAARLRLEGLKGRDALMAKQDIQLNKELIKARKLSNDPVFISHIRQIITNRHDEALAVYDVKQAEKELAEQKKQDALNERNRIIAAKNAHKQALKDYADVLAASKSIESSMESAMMSMVDGTKTVSAAFKSMASEIIKELYRIYVVKKITNMITGAIEGNFAPDVGATAAVPGVANGGPVQYGNSYLVGERGPEIFTPGMGGGQITSNSKSGIGSGVTIVQNINVSTGVQQTVRAEIRQMMPQIANSAKAAVVDAKRRGGSYGKAFA
jgi:hypothetical protein|tara:strand:- start:9306 stop:11048 length:1743 start_codon:yes stop_codon:yes gene_type:complete